MQSIKFFRYAMGSQELTRIWNQTRRGANQRRIPDREIENFSSPHVFSFQGDSWVIGRFSTSNERLVFLGGNLGTIGILDVRHTWDSPNTEAPPASCITAHRGLIMDLAEVPCSSAQSIDLLSASGDTTIRQWNLERCREVMTFTGHDRTVRSLSVNKDDPWMFISSSRDGTIQRWDRRCSKARDVYADPHSLEAMTPRKGRQRRSENPELSITSVQFVNKNQFVSGSVKADTGVRLWDLRFMKTKTSGSYTPVKIFNIKNLQNKAISCLTIDRFGSSLYAAVTDKNVYEFSLNSARTTPIHVFSGARFNVFDVAQMSISPVSDHLMCGSNDGTAVIWDLQETHLYVDDNPSVSSLSSICEIEPIEPKFQLNGHQEQVISVGWSASGNYMLTIDEEQLRVWDKSRPYSETLKDSTQMPGAFERIKKWRPTAIPASRLRASLDHPPAGNSLLSPSKDTAMRSAKRVAIEALQSPQKSIARNGYSPRTPQAKRIRIEQISPVLPPLITSPSSNKQLSPLIDMQKTPVKTPNKTPRKRMLLRPKNAFHAKYPTCKLPNIRYENYIKKIRGKAEEKSTPNNDPMANIASPSSMDDWLRRPAKGGHPSRLIRLQVPAEDEFTEASCSKMMTEAERLEAKSPVKKVIKTPVKATQGIPLVPQSLIAPAPSTTTTPRSMQRKLKFADENTPKADSASKIKTPASNSRNILHYFPRTPK